MLHDRLILKADDMAVPLELVHRLKLSRDIHDPASEHLRNAEIIVSVVPVRLDLRFRFGDRNHFQRRADACAELNVLFNFIDRSEAALADRPHDLPARK